MTPAECIAHYDDKEWEEFVNEWANGMRATHGYEIVDIVGGSGDKGVDVVGYLGPANVPDTLWDNYQCKHYAKPLQPSHIWVELGKLCYHTWKKHFTTPQRYRFVAPLGPSPSLKELLRHPERLREGLIANWVTHCQNGGITETENVLLEGDLLNHVQRFDFTIIGYLPTTQLLEEHSKTPFWHSRFDISLPDRPDPELPPADPNSVEARYIEQLLEAYTDHEGVPVVDLQQLATFSQLLKHFHRSREHFYEAESLHRFTRDHLPSNAFERFKKRVLAGVEDICNSHHGNAFIRLKQTTQAAINMQLPNDLLRECVTPGDLKGTCHHLANEDELIWKQ
jgi:hypothetical protein